MSAPQDQFDRDLLKLFDRACDSNLDDDALAQLQDFLRTHPTAASRFLGYMSMHADLYGAVRLSRVRENVTAQVLADDDPAAGVTPAAPSDASRPWVKKWATLLAATAALLALLIWGMEIDRSSLLAGSDSLEHWPDAVATLTRVDTVVWSDDSKDRQSGDFLSANDELRFEGGILEIEFRQGATVVLQGPASLVACGANHANLLRGSMAAVAPPWAKGFRVDTPKLKVIDHGTKFAVSVGAGDAGSEVNVLVSEGEVEVLRSQQAEQSQRLFAGQGIRTEGESIKQHNSDPDANRLTKKLSDRYQHNDAVVVGNRWGDWTPGSPGQPNRTGAWRYYSNVDGAFGEPEFYRELLWTDEGKGCFTLPEAALGGSRNPRGYARIHRDGGHPGRGKSQAEDELDHYAITAFTVPEDGVYRIDTGWLTRPKPKRWDLDHVLDIAVHVNDGPVVLREFCNRSCFTRFGCALGELAAGDVIYVGVGPNGVDYNDRFRLGFFIVKEVADVSLSNLTPNAHDHVGQTRRWLF